jgi:hypothetical protein
MMKFLLLILAATLPTVTPTAGPAPIKIQPGQMITLQVDGNRTRVVAIGAAPPITPYEAETARRMGAYEIPAAAGPQPAISFPRGSLANEPPAAVPGQVRLTFRRVPSPRPGTPDHALLFVLNGYDLSFRYRATMHANGKTQPTDVCEALPHLSVSEHWPYVIDQLDLSDLRLEPRLEGPVRCE